MYPVRILSIDGGGIRGIIPLKVLAYIENQTNKPISQLFNVMGGTSTGGIIALGLNCNNPKTNRLYTASELIKFYTDDADKIFKKSAIWKQGFFSPEYTSEGIENYLKEKFGEKTLLHDLPTTPDVDITVYSYDLEDNEIFYFNNRDRRAEPFFVWQAARATSAAPTFFPALEFKDSREDEDGKSLPPRQLIDGGVYINNPVVNLLVRARYLYPQHPKQNQLLVSIGTGQSKKSFSNFKDAGKIGLNPTQGWASAIFDVAMMGTSAEAEFQVAELLERVVFEDEGYEDRYYRFQKNFGKVDIPMDDIKQVKKLEQLGDDLVKEQRDKLDTLCAALKKIEP